MSELIDRNVLRAKMYQEAFESDTDMQKWDSGCWIRYKLFEKVVDSTPTVPYGPRWHRVEEELPKDRETVLIYCENTGGIVKSHYHEFIGSGGKKHYWFSGGTYYPKYWMPLPEPPKEDA